MKPQPVTCEQITAAVLTIAELIPFAPQSRAGQLIVIQELESFVSTDEQLAWLTQTAIRHMRKFSLPELRGLFCTRWKPKDGVDEYSTTAGFTAADLEGQYIERQAQETVKLIEQWKSEKLLAAPGTVESFEPGARLKLMPPKPQPIPANVAAAKIAAASPAQPPKDTRPLREIEAEVLSKIGPPRSPEETARLARELADAVDQRKKA